MRLLRTPLALGRTWLGRLPRDYLRSLIRRLRERKGDKTGNNNRNRGKRLHVLS
jgi:hypothetical protein